MNKVRKLILFNHDYHLKSILNLDNQRCIQINVKTKYPLFEVLNPFELLFKKHKYKKKIKNELNCINELTIYGCQDYLSWYLYNIAKKKGIKINIVPDNLEFFLRPIEEGYSKLNIKQLIKIVLFNLYSYKLNKDYSFFQNRLIYKIEKKDIDFSKSFFVKIDEKAIKKNKTKIIVFISQPYYIDYNIDTDTWGAKTKSYLLALQEKGFTVFIKYHQRDSLKFKGFMDSCGFSEVDESLEIPKKYVGIFSTYLFELSLEGQHVTSVFNYFKQLFPREYVLFVNIISNQLLLDLDGEKKWSLTNKDTLKLIELINN